MTNVIIHDGTPPEQEAAHIVAGPARHGMVDGIEVDLRIDEIDPTEWAPRRAWYMFPFPAPASAKLLFPSTAERCRQLDQDWMPAADVFELIRGDKVAIHDWDISDPDVLFDHAHDVHRVLVTLKVIRGSDEFIRPTPLALFGASELRGVDPQLAYDNLVRRIFAGHGIAAFPEPEVAVTLADDDLGVRALSAARGVAVHREMLRTLLAQVAPENVADIELYAGIMLNMGVLAGFYQAKHELREAEARAGSFVEGQRSAARSNTNWGRIDLSRRFAADNPAWRRNRIATEVIKVLKLPEQARRPIMKMLSRESIGPEP